VTASPILWFKTEIYLKGVIPLCYYSIFGCLHLVKYFCV